MKILNVIKYFNFWCKSGYPKTRPKPRASRVSWLLKNKNNDFIKQINLLSNWHKNKTFFNTPHRAFNLKMRGIKPLVFLLFWVFKHIFHTFSTANKKIMKNQIIFQHNRNLLLSFCTSLYDMFLLETLRPQNREIRDTDLFRYQTISFLEAVIEFSITITMRPNLKKKNSLMRVFRKIIANKSPGE